jgi:hypothetical protein
MAAVRDLLDLGTPSLRCWRFERGVGDCPGHRVVLLALDRGLHTLAKDEDQERQVAARRLLLRLRFRACPPPLCELARVRAWRTSLVPRAGESGFAERTRATLAIRKSGTGTYLRAYAVDRTDLVAARLGSKRERVRSASTSRVTGDTSPGGCYGHLHRRSARWRRAVGRRLADRSPHAMIWELNE